MFMLQFGHACLRVETRYENYVQKSRFSLQFGHACLRVETWFSRMQRVAGRCFNSATPACAWRPPVHGVTVYRVKLLQFGHACLRVETLGSGIK